MQEVESAVFFSHHFDFIELRIIKKIHIKVDLKIPFFKSALFIVHSNKNNNDDSDD